MTETEKKPVYSRAILKLSGEYFSGQYDFGLDVEIFKKVVALLKPVLSRGVEIGVVVGGGNYLRGSEFSQKGFSRISADQMGMLATIMNGIALRDSLFQQGITAIVMSAVPIPGLVEQFDRFKAIDYLRKKKVVIFVGGTGNPLFSTDSAASLRAIEVNAEVVLKATKENGVYSDDPRKNPSAELFDHLSLDEAIRMQLKVMDMAALCLCRDHHLPIKVFNMNSPNILERMILGSEEGTLVD